MTKNIHEIEQIGLKALLSEAATYDPANTHYTQERAEIVAALIQAQRQGKIAPGPVPGQVSL